MGLRWMASSVPSRMHVIFYVKRKSLHVFAFLWLLGATAPLVKCECIYFCTNVHIWIDLAGLILEKSSAQDFVDLLS